MISEKSTKEPKEMNLKLKKALCTQMKENCEKLEAQLAKAGNMFNSKHKTSIKRLYQDIESTMDNLGPQEAEKKRDQKAEEKSSSGFNRFE